MAILQAIDKYVPKTHALGKGCEHIVDVKSTLLLLVAFGYVQPGMEQWYTLSMS